MASLHHPRLRPQFKGIVLSCYLVSPSSAIKMGLLFSLPGRFGFNVNSVASDQVYKEFFENVKTFDDFYCSFIEVCSKFNEVMPGKHYIIDADREQIKAFFDRDWNKETGEEERKKLLIKYMSERVKDSKSRFPVMFITAFAAPAAGILLKKSGEKVPQLKKLRIDLVPDFVVVPGVTLLSIIGVRLLNLKTASSKIKSSNKPKTK